MIGTPENKSLPTVPRLQYQSAVPALPSQLAVWLLMSAEVMLFTALVGAYVILRFGLPAGSWPSSQEVHLSVPLGTVSTILLLCSSVTVWLTQRHTGQDVPRIAKKWLWATLALGGMFLAIEAYEYRIKYQRGIFPRAPRSLIHDQADLVYLQNVKAQSKRLIQQSRSANVSSKSKLTMDQFRQLQTGLVDWTERIVGRSSDPLTRKRSIEALAWQIYPDSFDHRRSARVKSFLDSEAESNRQRLNLLRQQVKDIQHELKQVQNRLAQKQRELAEIQGNAIVPQTLSGIARVKDELSAVKKRAAALTLQVSELTAERDFLGKRMNAVKHLTEPGGGGLNQRFSVNLPIVVRGGNTWTSTYFLLTGFHGLHTVVGMGALLYLVPMNLNQQHSLLLENICLYWHFVVAVWLMLFGLIYLS